MKSPSLIPVYQPIVDITNSDIIAFEANIRGEDENGKVIRYEALRDANLIVDLDFKARDLALNQFKLRKHKLFVNVAPQEMDKPLFFEDVDFSNVVLEITEESSIKDAQRSRNRLKKLRENGLNVALDDFGSQQQNHDKLDEFEPDFVKLDKSIVKNAKPEVLEMFVPMIPHYKIIVEGVETIEQLQRCKSLGFHFVQGYYLSIPLPYEALLTDLYNEDLQASIQQKLSELT